RQHRAEGAQQTLTLRAPYPRTAGGGGAGEPAAALARPDDRTGHRSSDAHRFGVLEVRVDRSDDYARFDRDQVDAHERDPDPGVDDDAFVENSIEYIDEAGAARCPFDCHRLPAFPLCLRR